MLPGHGVEEQVLERLVAERERALALLVAELADVVLRPAAGISSRRSRSGGRCSVHDLQAIEQVLAEAALRDQLLEVGVGGGDDADVDLDRVRLAERVDFLVLEEAQQLGLHVEADVADLVEEQRAAGGGADDARETALSAPVNAPLR